MSIALAETFLSALINLGRGEQKSTAEFVEKFHRNPAQPGISLERITQTKSDNLWSARVTQGLRAVVHKEGDLWNLLYVGHHDDAYTWARRRTLERNSHTGTLQIVVAPEEMAEQIAQVPCPPEAKPLFQKYNDEYLLSLGVPGSWLPTIRIIVLDDQLLQVIPDLPEEVAERLLDLASGKLVTPPAPPSANIPAIEAEDSQRRFYVIEDSDELLRMLSAPMAKWIGFLHPTQKKLVTGKFNGPVKVTGSAGTGKTVVAMHRARHLARQGKSVLLTSYVGTLCDNIRENLKYLCSADELSRITVDTVHAQALQLVRAAGEKPTIIDDQDVSKMIDRFHWGACPLDTRSLQNEWTEVIQAQGIKSWDQYRDANRKGRGQALGVKDRKLVWQVFDQVLQRLTQNRMCDWSSLCQRAHDLLQAGKVRSKYNAVIVDEVQDLRPQEIRFLAALARDEQNNLMLVGDGGQRIYGSKLTLKSLNVDIRGRSFVLKINYRTTAQIRAFADDLLTHEQDDLDEGQEDRSDTKSLLKGPEPVLTSFSSTEEQVDHVIRSIVEAIKQGVSPQDIAVFARTNELLNPYEKALKLRKIDYRQLKKESADSIVLGVNLGTMHRAKGLEFKVVFVVEASREYLPLPVALRTLKDQGDRQDVMEKERHLLYVSITRARDEVFISWVGRVCEFLELARNTKQVAIAKGN